MDAKVPAALLAGLLVGVLLTGPLAGGSLAPTTDAEPEDSPGYSLAKAGPSCYDGPQSNGGWIHVVAGGERYAVTLNATVVHEPGTEIATDVERRPTGEYEIALRTIEETEEKPFRDGDCRRETDLDLGTGLHEPRFSVTLDGREVLSVDQEETTANLYPLPRPLNATESPIR